MALPGMDEKILLLRQENDDFHKYPYTSLPTLKSHLHPTFAIFNARMKLGSLDDRPDELEKLLDKYPSLAKIFALYKAWT